MSDKTPYRLHAAICKALANPIRIEIIDILNGNEMGFSDLQKVAGIPKSNLSQHLSLMVSAGIVIQRRNGLNTFYRLSSPKIADACGLMREVLIENLQKHSNLIKQWS